MTQGLLDETLPHADYKGGVKQENYSMRSGSIEVYFRDQVDVLCNEINEADAILGCVAWLTNMKILQSLRSLKYGASIVVQKEDFLRPDNDMNSRCKLQHMYQSVPPFYGGHPWCSGIYTTDLTDSLNTNSDTEDFWDCAIRCCGNHNADRNPSFPRMHNKFLVFGKVGNESLDKLHDESFGETENESNECYKVFHPYAVWTGSLNLTHSATKSFENAVLIRDKSIATAYMNEWSQIRALSEPLDWDSEWCCPDQRIGT